MIIKVGREFLRKMYRSVLTDLDVSKKDYSWFIDQFEDCYITEDGDVRLGDGDKSYFVDCIDELALEGYDEFEIVVVDGRDISLSLDSGDEDGEELSDCFYDFIYDAMERFGEESVEVE